ncbi:MAG: hypothetical protein ACM3PO_02450, partial [Betaproteobacteria bacterium]
SLVGSGQLEAQGNIRKWRYSEVDRSSILQNQIPISLRRGKKGTSSTHTTEADGQNSSTDENVASARAMI